MKRRSKIRATAAKAQRPKSARPKRQSVADDAVRLVSHAASEGREVARLTRELSEAREQQSAASEILEVISSSPDDLQPVFATMLEKAVRICDATFGSISRLMARRCPAGDTQHTPCLCGANKALTFSP